MSLLALMPLHGLAGFVLETLAWGLIALILNLNAGAHRSDFV